MLQKKDLRETAINQALGFAALIFIIFAVMNGYYKALLFAACLVPLALVVIKPNSIPYLFVLSFFTTQSIFELGILLGVQVADVTFLLLILAFFANKKIDFGVVYGKQRFLFIAFCLFTLWALIGFLVNLHLHTNSENATSLFFVINCVQMCAAIVMFSQPQWENIRNKIFFFFMLCLLGEIAVVIAQMLFPEVGAVETYSQHKRIGGTFGHHGMIGNIMVLSLGVISYVFFESRDKRVKNFSIVMAVLSVATIIISGSRSSMLGIFLAMPVTILLIYRFKLKTLGILVLSAAAMFAVIWFTPVKGIILSTVRSHDTGTIDISSYGRILIWERVYEHALYAPWVQKIAGIGIGTFTSIKFSYILEKAAFTTGAHNNFLHAFAETGIVGLIIFLAIFFDIVKRLVLLSRRKNNIARVFLFSTLVLLFSCFTQETFWFNPAFGRFWLIYMFFYLMIFNFTSETRLEKEC